MREPRRRHSINRPECPNLVRQESLEQRWKQYHNHSSYAFLYSLTLRFSKAGRQTVLNPISQVFP
jgi:hypothetical protein